MHRNQAVELLRIVSALGIVWYHAVIWGSFVAYAGLVVFLILSPYFEASKESNSRSILGLASRLLVPWVIWMIIYALFNVLRNDPPVPMQNGLIAGILIGSGEHLWFLPFIVAILVLVALCQRIVGRAGTAVLSSALLVTLVATFTWWRPASMEAGIPIAQYMHALVPATLGAAWGAMGFPQHNRPWGVLLLAAVASTLFMGPSGGIAYTIGAVAVAIALTGPVREVVSRLDVTRLSGAMFGVYLVHVLALWPMRPVIRIGIEIPAVFAAFLASLAFVLVVRKLNKRASTVLFGH